MTVYLIHFSQSLCHARHYVGWAESVDRRLEHHRNGTGANLLRVLNGLGIEYQVVRTWEGEDRTFERKLKDTHHTARYCPVCQGKPRDYHPMVKALSYQKGE